MAKAGTRSKSQEAYYASYKASSKWKTNRERRLKRTVKEQPNNEQARLALQSLVYRRKTPNTNKWSHGDIRIAKLFKEFIGYVDELIFNSNEKVRAAALSASKRKVFEKLPEGKVDFTLGARLQGIRG
jgi:hypothetical protein